MKALSIRQPWAWAILHAGKDIENRDWRPSNPGVKFRGEFLIHASKGMARDEYEGAAGFIENMSGTDVPAFGDLPRGGIVGIAEIADAVTKHDSPWAGFGNVCLVIRNARLLPFTPLKGMLGFFDVGPWAT